MNRKPDCAVIFRSLNLFGSHSPPLAASSARVSEPDVWLTAARERLTLSSPNTPPLGAGILYSLRGAFPAACGVTCSRQRARRPAHRCTRTAHPFFSEYPAPWGGDPLFSSGRIPRRLRRNLLASASPTSGSPLHENSSPFLLGIPRPLGRGSFILFGSHPPPLAA